MKCFNAMDELLAMVERARDRDLGNPPNKPEIDVTSSKVSVSAMDNVTAEEDVDRLEAAMGSNSVVKKASDLDLCNAPGKSKTEESSDGVSAAAMDAIADEDFDRLWDEAVVEAAAKSHDVSSEQTGEGSVNEEIKDQIRRQLEFTLDII